MFKYRGEPYAHYQLDVVEGRITMTVEFVKDLPNNSTGASQCLVKKGEDFFVVSLFVTTDTGWFETLVFPADSKGVVTDWGEVAGGQLVSREEAIAQLESMPLYVSHYLHSLATEWIEGRMK